MKKHILKAFICLFTILLLSCEKDLYEDAIHQQHEHQSNINVKTLSFEEFTQKMKAKNLKTGLEGFMNASQMGSSQAKSGEDTFEIITVDIRQVTSGTYTSYTMFLKTPDPDDKNFYNITFEEKEQDIVLFITKYIATENWITNKNSAFEGEIFTKRIPGNVTEANRLIKLTEAFEGLPDAGNNNPGSGVGSGGGGGTNSGNYPQDCDGEVRTTIIVEPIMCSEYLHWPWSPDECVADVKATFQTTYIYECIPDNPNPIGGGTPGSGTGSGSGGGDGTSGGSTAPSLTSIISTQPLECPFPPPGDMDLDCFIDEDEANYLAFINDLSLEQKQFLKNNPLVKDEVFDFLVGEAFHEEAQEEAEGIIKANIIEDKIDDSLLDPCTKAILNQLKGLQQNDIAKIIQKLNEGIPNDKKRTYNTKIFPATYLPSNSHAQANWQDQNGNAVPRNYNIKLQNSYLNGSLNTYNPGAKPTKLSIARTLIHEMIHVYFYTLFDDCYYQQICEGLESYPLLWENYLATKNISSNNSQHITMANEFIKIIASALQEFQTGIPVPDNVEPGQDYKDLAWLGLSGNILDPNDSLAQIFNLEYPIGSDKRIRFESINDAEDYQQSVFYLNISPKSTPCN